MNLPVKSRHIMVLTGEPSGDVHAGKVIREIKKRDASIYFSGIGGPHLQKENVDLFYHISKLSAMGITEVLVQFRQIKQAFDRFKKKLKQYPFDLIIIVDYPGFNLKAAQYVKLNYNIPILYYITPKVWAWKRSRLKQIQEYVDHAALILPFEKKIYKDAGIPATYVGNPLMEDYPTHLTKPFLKNKANDPGDIMTIGLLPGSRKSEINRLLDVMLHAAILIGRHKKVRFVISKADSIYHDQIEKGLNKINSELPFEIFQGPVREIFIKSDLIIAASGTATLEAALCCVPTILIYKMSAITYRIGKILVKLEYVGLANLIVKKQVMPEFLQDDANPEQICKKAVQILDNLQFYENRLKSVRQFLGDSGASKRTAALAMQLMRS